MTAPKFNLKAFLSPAGTVVAILVGLAALGFIVLPKDVASKSELKTNFEEHEAMKSDITDTKVSIGNIEGKLDIIIDILKTQRSK
jgi:hypothetical protein